MFAVLVVGATLWFGGVHAAAVKDHVISVKSSVNNMTIANGDTHKVPTRECGYIVCDASAFNLDPTKHSWYSLKWEMPAEVTGDKDVFQLGGEYQMPHAYLVFRNFKNNLSGKYRCSLLFNETQVGSHTIHLIHDDSVSSNHTCKPWNKP